MAAIHNYTYAHVACWRVWTDSLLHIMHIISKVKDGKVNCKISWQ